MAVHRNYNYEIRHWIASTLGDLWLGTVDSSADASTITVASLIPGYDDNDNFFNRFNFYCYEGTNVGDELIVDTWTNSSHELTLTPDASASFDTDSKFELHRLFTKSDYERAINMAIEDTQGMLWEARDDTTVVLVEDETNDGDDLCTYEYTLPTTFQGVYRVIKEGWEAGKKLSGTVSTDLTLGEQVVGSSSSATGIVSYSTTDGYILIREVDGTFETGENAVGQTSGNSCSSITSIEDEEVGDGKFERKDILDPRDWTLLKADTEKIKFDERYVSIVGDLRIRLLGYARQAQVSNDTDYIYTPPKWIIERAIMYLPMQKCQQEWFYRRQQQATQVSQRVPSVVPNWQTKMVAEV